MVSCIVFKCTGCGRFLYQEEGVETRECPCGETVKISSAIILGEADGHKEARAKVQALQEKKEGKPLFFRYKDKKSG